MELGPKKLVAMLPFDGKRICEVRAVRNVVVRVAPQDILTSVLNREGGWVPQRIPSGGWRMTGSAFAILSRRGTLCSGWLRRIISFRKGEVWRGIAPDCI